MAATGFGAAVIARLDELRLAAIEQRVDADLLTGVTEPLVAELEELVVAHPRREPLAARLMRALHACGRRGAALEVYEQARKRLADRDIRGSQAAGGGQSTQRVLIVTPPFGRPPARAAARTQKCDHMFSWISLASRRLL